MINEANYQRANDFLSNKQYDEAITVFTSLVDYKNSKEMLNEARYEKAKDLFADNLYVESIEIFNDIQEYKDSKDLLLEACYQEAIVSINSEQYSSAIYYLTKIKGYKDSNDLINKVNYMWGKQLVELSDWKNAVGLLTQVQQQIYPDAKELLNKAYYMWGKQLVEVYDWKDAVDVFTKIQQPYSDSDVLLKNAKYELAKEKASSGDYMAAYYLVENLNYKDSAKLAEDYAKIAFAWHITGSMTKSSYSRSEKFTVNITVSGGRPDATISVLVVCTTPDWTVSNVLSKLKNGDGYQVYFFNQNPPYASTGSGIITIKNYSTGEVLATFTFSIYY